MSGADYEDSLTFYWSVLRRSSLVVLCTGLGAAVLFYLASFLLPPSYRATVSLIPLRASDNLGTLGLLGFELSNLGIGGKTGEISPVMFPDIIESRALLEAVLKQSFVPSTGAAATQLLDWLRPPGTGRKRFERALKTIRKRVSIQIDRRAGIVKIEYSDKDPRIASEVANSLAAHLQNYTVTVLAAHAGEKRVFIEGRLKEVGYELAKAEDELRRFREQNVRIGNSPHLFLEESRLKRSLREQEEIYLTLRREYELAKVEEHKDVSQFAILDRATPPAEKSWPRRSLLAAIGLILGCAGMYAWQCLRPTMSPLPNS